MPIANADAIVGRLLAALGQQAVKPSMGGDGFVFGDAKTPVDHVAVCRAPTAAVLRQLPASGRTLLIAREDPFYWTSNRYGGAPAWIWSAGLEDALKNNPVTQIKRQIMTERGVVVYRLSAGWDKARPAAASDALATALGMRPSRGADLTTAYAASPVATLDALSRHVREKLGTRAIRVTGDPKGLVSRLAVINGLVTLPRLASAIKDPAVNGVILGETVEWEATPYFQDLIASGRAIGMVLVGYAASDNPGLPAMAAAVQAALKAPVLTLQDTAERQWVARGEIQ